MTSLDVDFNDPIVNRRLVKSQKDLYEKYKDRMNNDDRGSLYIMNKILEQSWKNNMDATKRCMYDNKEKYGISYRENRGYNRLQCNGKDDPCEITNDTYTCYYKYIGQL